MCIKLWVNPCVFDSWLLGHAYPAHKDSQVTTNTVAVVKHVSDMNITSYVTLQRTSCVSCLQMWNCGEMNTKTWSDFTFSPEPHNKAFPVSGRDVKLPVSISTVTLTFSLTLLHIRLCTVVVSHDTICLEAKLNLWLIFTPTPQSTLLGLCHWM